MELELETEEIITLNSNKSMCKLDGDKGHAWKDCFNYPMSEKFKGTTKCVQDNKPKDGDDKNKTNWADGKKK